MIENLFAPYFCRYSSDFLHVITNISKKINIYELHYQKGFEYIGNTVQLMGRFINREYTYINQKSEDFVFY